jgi:hypothetical protein
LTFDRCDSTQRGETLATTARGHAGPISVVQWLPTLFGIGALIMMGVLLVRLPQIPERPAGADWAQLPALLEGEIVDTHRMTASTGWAVTQDASGQYSSVYRVRWRADSWELRQELVVEEPLSSITMDEAGIVYARGSSGVLYLRERAGWRRAERPD